MSQYTRTRAIKWWNGLSIAEKMECLEIVSFERSPEMLTEREIEAIYSERIRNWCLESN